MGSPVRPQPPCSLGRATDRSIDVQVMRLRRLIETDPAQPRHIQTVWGVGYVFVPEGKAAGAATP